ncbi:MAG: hypothetical protein A2Y16_06960 [Tenericutes bacterium GWF2_57_13]|nr:MAG: hypothetical protein A2Y16_06960 [Tenericutes bacterium GWF2_57_13]
MAEYNVRFKRNVYFILAFAVLSLSVLFAAGTIFTLTVALAIDETSVGHIYLGNRPEADYPSYLERRVSEWRSTASYRLGFQGYLYDIELDALTFDADATAENIVRDVNNSAVFTLSTLSRDAIRAGIDSLFSAQVTSHFDFDAFIDDLLDDVSHLYQFKTYRLDDYLAPASAETVLATSLIDGLSADDVDAIVAFAGNVAISALDRFSLLETFAASDLDNDRLSILASGMQAVSVGTRFQSFLYRTLPVMPGWAEIGANVRILRVNGLDFSFYNPMDSDYRFVVSEADATTLRIELVGHPFVETIDAVWERAAFVPFPIETIEDLTLNAATPGVIVIDTDDETIYRVVVRTGVDGEIWFLNRTVTAPGEAPVEAMVAIDERPSVAAIYRENIVPKGGD